MTAPERIYHVSSGQLSVARHFGGCRLNGKEYHYDTETDQLVRHDVWKKELKEDKDKAKRIAKAEKEKWEKLQASLL
jgi:DMSO/TMAO reductase YedYZ molybdopterin-dependent catalytic subunit